MKKDNAAEIGKYSQAIIKYVKLGKEVNIEYEVQHGELTDNYLLQSADEPTLEFKAALNDLSEDFCDICEIGEYEAPRIKIKSIKLSYEGEPGKKAMNASISATRKLNKSNKTMSMISPILPEVPPNKKHIPMDTTPKLPASAVTKIYVIIDEARKYLNGVRAQTSLPLETIKENIQTSLS